MKINAVSLVVTHNQAFNNLSQVTRKNIQLLYADEQVKKVFSPAPFVSIRSARNLISYLLKSKIYPLERKVSSAKCKSKRCLVCLNVSETDAFQSFQTKEQCKINQVNCKLNCNDKYLIYLLSCKICGLQYVGSTTDKFRLRWNNYKENNRKAKRGEEHMQPLVFEHFSSNDHKGFFIIIIIIIIVASIVINIIVIVIVSI